MFEPTTLPIAIDAGLVATAQRVADADREFGSAGAERHDGEPDHHARHPGASGQPRRAPHECLGTGDECDEPCDQECDRGDAHGVRRLRASANCHTVPGLT